MQEVARLARAGTALRVASSLTSVRFASAWGGRVNLASLISFSLLPYLFIDCFFLSFEICTALFFPQHPSVQGERCSDFAAG